MYCYCFLKVEYEKCGVMDDKTTSLLPKYKIILIKYQLLLVAVITIVDYWE